MTFLCLFSKLKIWKNKLTCSIWFKTCKVLCFWFNMGCQCSTTNLGSLSELKFFDFGMVMNIFHMLFHLVQSDGVFIILFAVELDLVFSFWVIRLNFTFIFDVVLLVAYWMAQCRFQVLIRLKEGNFLMLFILIEIFFIHSLSLILYQFLHFSLWNHYLLWCNENF